MRAARWCDPLARGFPENCAPWNGAKPSRKKRKFRSTVAARFRITIPQRHVSDGKSGTFLCGGQSQ
jgi:hypothetical protein